MLSINNLRLGYGETTLIQQLNCEIASGDFVALIGENGCGKSSLLKAIAGLQSPQQGQICFLDKPLSQWQPKAMAKQRAMMAQSADANTELLVIDILELSRHQFKETKRQRSLRIAELSHQFQITKLLQRAIANLSGGERQRVFLAKAVLQLQDEAASTHPFQENHYHNQLLLLDEPTSAMDFRHQSEIMLQLQRLNQQGLTIICISHDINLISPYAKTMMVLAEKQCIANAAPAKVLSTDILRRCYGLEPQLISREPLPPLVVANPALATA